MEKGIKHDSEKVRVELLDPDWLIGVGKVLTFGARKYDSHNWRKGLEITRCIGAALRHIFAFLAGEDIDADSGLPHLDCASCELMFVSWLIKNRPDLDDRWSSRNPAHSPQLELGEETPGDYAKRLRSELAKEAYKDLGRKGNSL